MNGSVDAHIMAALDGTGDFENTSNTVRYQGIAKLTANLGMVAYTIHELNSAVAKADAGNVDNDSGAPHNWDEGWAFFHGPDEDYGCSPAKVMEKRAADFGTADENGVAATFAATEAAMVSGLAALQASDADGYNGAVDTIVKNVMITYSQAVLKYTSKMDSNTTAEKYQAEGYAFWKTMEAYAAPHMHDGCDNSVLNSVFLMGEINASTCDAFVWTQHNGEGDYMCYNSDLHFVYAEGTTEEICDGFASVFPESGMPGYYADYGASKIVEIFDLKNDGDTDADYEAHVRMYLQPVWDAFGITADDIGTLQ